MAQPTAEPICAAPGYGCCLPAKPQSATDVWHAWHGLRPYKNKPVQGGMPVMENCHQGWRKTYLSNKQSHFSCWKTTLLLMDEEIVLRSNAEVTL